MGVVLSYSHVFDLFDIYPGGSAVENLPAV